MMLDERNPKLGMPYGERRLCAAWQITRSSYCARVARPARMPADAQPSRCSAMLVISDETLATCLCAAITEGSFTGEGHYTIYQYIRRTRGTHAVRDRARQLVMAARNMTWCAWRSTGISVISFNSITIRANHATRALSQQDLRYHVTHQCCCRVLYSQLEEINYLRPHQSRCAVAAGRRSSLHICNTFTNIHLSTHTRKEARYE